MIRGLVHKYKDKENWEWPSLFLIIAKLEVELYHPMPKDLLIYNIRDLIQTEDIIRTRVCGNEMSDLNTQPDAFLSVRDGIISEFGSMRDLGKTGLSLKDPETTYIDAGGKLVFPSFCDSHTHLVYAGSREAEFTGKIKGMSYVEIARRGGGILDSVKKLRQSTEEELFTESMTRVNEIIAQGTGAVEIKSGYGLNLEEELKMLRVIRKIRNSTSLEVRSTFLGAHAVPPEFEGQRDKYIDLIINEMIPVVASEELADYIDVFCDRGFFTAEETESILMAGMKYGLTAKLHANELDYSGGINVGVKYNALSVDHLEYTGDEDIEILSGSDTIPTLLPDQHFFSD